MVDPLAEVVTFLQPSVTLTKVVGGAGTWRVRSLEVGQPFYSVILDGSCRLEVDGHEPIILQAGDFILIPAAYSFTSSSLEPPISEDGDALPVALLDGTLRLGNPDGPPDVLSLVGHCLFSSPDAALLVSLLPQVVHVRGEKRLTTLVQLLCEESRELRSAREIILVRLLEVLFIEALRSTAGIAAAPGLSRGLADGRLSIAIRRMHESPSEPWTVTQLAKEAALSRSVFFERFRRAVGVAPMEYLLAWRMALAKNLLLRKEGSMAEVAERVGYRSQSTFCVAFTRYVGLPPTQYARAHRESRRQ